MADEAHCEFLRITFFMCIYKSAAHVLCNSLIYASEELLINISRTASTGWDAAFVLELAPIK